MRHLLLNDPCDTYTIAVLVTQPALDKKLLNKHISSKLDNKDVIAFTLKEDGSKTPVKLINEYLPNLLKALDMIGVKYLYTCNSAYFKKLTGEKKVVSTYGYIFPCVHKDYEHMNVVLGVNPKSLYFDPTNIDKIDLSIDAVNSHIKNNYKELGSDALKEAHYPSSVEDIREHLNQLHKYDVITADIEALSLKFWEAGIESIAFAWSNSAGVAFLVDRANKHRVRLLLKNFFIQYKGKVIWHNCAYDSKVIIYSLWMNNLLDQKGLLTGLEVMTKNFGDTQIETYLATNSCAGNTLGLKPNVHEYLGNYGLDVTDTSLINNEDLLKYNLLDAIGTYWLHEKMHPILVADNQEPIYEEFMLPSARLLLHVELTGMCMDMGKVLIAEEKLEAIKKYALSIIHGSTFSQDLLILLRLEESIACHKKWKKKTEPIEHFDYVEFNPNSGLQVGKLLHDVIGLPILETTPTGIPCTGADELNALKGTTSQNAVTELLDALIDLTKVSKILSSFIPSFKDALLKDDGYHYLHGSFKVTGTISVRLSCKEPNLQTTPSGSTFAKLIKDCFVAPEGWVMCGADYASLEATIAAKLTQDKNRLKVYQAGFDMHSLNAKAFFGSQMNGIDDSVDSINSIKKKYPELRQDAKAPFFACSYAGTWLTLMKNCGFSKEQAIEIEDNYHELYSATDKWTADRLKQGEKDGYVTGFMGLRVRTPVMQQSLMGSKATTSAAAGESRSAGNALTQSYCALNSRSSIEFMNRVYTSKYKYDIKPIALIHDSIYLLIRNDIDVLHWVNINLPDCMSWRGLPELQQDDIPLKGNLDLHYPSWATAIEIPNHATKEEILTICDEATNED